MSHSDAALAGGRGRDFQEAATFGSANESENK